MTTALRPTVAVVGAGPAGAYAAAQVQARCGADVDIFERLPTPGGLLRYGVAPDHQQVKRLQDRLDSETFGRGCRFIGNIEVGVDVSPTELLDHYTAVFFATGAPADRSLRISGENRPGSWPARTFVGWYNGHPDCGELEFDLTSPRAVVIGNGNVAADVARMLLLSPEALERTDMADHAVGALRASRIREVVLVGRSGPAQAAFTNATLRELGDLADVDVHVDAGDLELDAASRQWLTETATFTQRTNLDLLRGFAERRRPPARKRLVLRFLRSPVAVVGERKAEGLEIHRNEMVRTDGGAWGVRPLPGSTETIECGLILRAVGYQGVRLPGLPYDDRRKVLPTARGRVLDHEGRPIPGVYAVGWVKRGPTGILGTNKRDAHETVSSFIDDLNSGSLPHAPYADRHAIDELLAARKLSVVTAKGWRAIDAREVSSGRERQRPRTKLTSRQDLLAAAAESG